MKKLLLLLTLVSVANNAQELKKHLWEHRLLVIFTSEFNTAEVEEQLKILQDAEEDLKDRKLKIYTITEDQYRFGFSDIEQATKKKRLITKPFEIVLIGLDGGEKYRASEVQPMQAFNELIDRMPMRQNELRKNKN